MSERWVRAAFIDDPENGAEDTLIYLNGHARSIQLMPGKAKADLCIAVTAFASSDAPIKELKLILLWHGVELDHITYFGAGAGPTSSTPPGAEYQIDHIFPVPFHSQFREGEFVVRTIADRVELPQVALSTSFPLPF